MNFLEVLVKVKPKDRLCSIAVFFDILLVVESILLLLKHLLKLLIKQRYINVRAKTEIGTDGSITETINNLRDEEGVVLFVVFWVSFKGTNGLI